MRQSQTNPWLSKIDKTKLNTGQWRRQNAEKVTHIKMILLDQAVVLFNYVPFQNWNFS